MSGFGLPEAVALAILLSLVLYVLLGGADFGGGVWDLLATGPRRREQRALIEDVIGPVWEVNHIWLILSVVLLFTGFPAAFAVLSTALHIPITLMLVGIVLRGTAFVFRQYDDRRDEVQRRWGRVFAVASIVTPVFLGVCLGAITAGGIRVTGDLVTTGFFRSWLAPFPFLCGLFALVLFAFLAAVYLTNETTDPGLREDFRRRAIGAGAALGVVALAAAISAPHGAAEFGARLFGSWWSLPLQILTGAAAIGAFAALITRRPRWARMAAAAQAALIVLGWGFAQQPYLIAPDITLHGAAAPAVTLAGVLTVLGGGALVLLPALYWLLRTFRLRQRQG